MTKPHAGKGVNKPTIYGKVRSLRSFCPEMPIHGIVKGLRRGRPQEGNALMSKQSYFGQRLGFLRSFGHLSFWLHGLLLCLQLSGIDTAAVLWGQSRPGPVLRLAYRHYAGQKYRIVAQVDEQVFRNRKLIYNTQILNRIAIAVESMNGLNAILDVNYQVSEEAENGRFFSWTKENNSQFELSPQGQYLNVGPNDLTPSLRNVPSFPARELEPGDGWSAPGSEVQDLREVFGLPVELRFNFDVNYMYRGEETFQGRKLQHITLFYNIAEDVSKQLPTSLQPRFSHGSPQRYSRQSRRQDGQKMRDIPRSVRAQHNIELYWDSRQGLPVFQKEDFEVAYLLQNGEEVKFRGRSRGDINIAETMKHQDMKRELERELQQAGIRAEVKQNDKGLSISIDSINFYPDSKRMLPGEERKLQRISRILQKYPERDIQVSGHTADLGQAAQQQKLSQARAATVGQYLIDRGVRSREQVVIRGMGATQPIANNSTEQGRKKNRRVEITLLEN